MSDKERWFCTTCKEIRYQDEPRLYCTKCKGKTVVHREEAMFDEIERLREEVKQQALTRAHELEQANKRIEELEKRAYVMPDAGIWITTEQIRAAWAVSGWEDQEETTGILALKELDIVRCEGYGCKGGYVNGVKCPKCNGEGWVRRDP